MAHNLTWYNNRIREMESALEVQAAKIQQMIVTFDAIEPGIDKEIAGDLINAAYDVESEMESAIESMYRARDRRNWTGADWTMRALILDNID